MSLDCANFHSNTFDPSSVIAKSYFGTFLEMSRRCRSDVISFWPFPFPFPVVVLNSYASIRAAMLSPDTAGPLSGRLVTSFETVINPKRYGSLPRLSNYFSSEYFADTVHCVQYTVCHRVFVALNHFRIWHLLYFEYV